jgi:predicted HTH transcriptional regulator
MLIHGKQFSELEETDLQSLIEDQVAEGKYIEYKKSLPGNSDRDKKEFLADVSSFSNSAGGYIFYGICESNGLPVELVGIHGIDPDAEILRFENLLRDAIAPRLTGLSIRAIQIEGNASILALNITKSWASPHMVTFAGSSRFFARNSAGKYQLDVFELRSAFNATNIVAENLNKFRTERNTHPT